MPTPRLHLTASIEEKWQAVVGPWLREQAVSAWKNPKPTVILTPSRAESFYLRGRLVQEGVNFLGLRFWTPSDLRTFLLGELSPKIQTATQAELRLVARVAAETLLEEQNADQPIVSVAREPGSFLRGYDLLLGAGWDPAKDGAPYGRSLTREMGRLVEQKGIATQSGIHRQLLQQVAEDRGEPLFSNLLIVGFNAAHWPLWDLLRVAVFCSEQADIALSGPRYFGQDVDQLWIGSWEQALGTPAKAPDFLNGKDHVEPFAPLIDAYEKGVPGDVGESDLTFLVTPDLTSQAQAIVLQAMEYLGRDSCTRLGIVFPEVNALALEVSAHLRRLEIPIDDGTASFQPGIFEHRGWAEWIALQEEASVSRLIAWLRAFEAQELPSGLGEIKARDAANLLSDVLGETLVDHLDFMAEHLEQNPRKRHAGDMADFLRQRIVLPDKATFAEFLALTRNAFVAIGWEKHLAQLQVELPTWLMQSDWVLSRRAYLGWLRESTDSRERTSGANGNHFYGKVHLLIYAQMTGQTWSHLILTGLNENVWPRMFEAEAWGSRHELAALNRMARDLNRQGTEQGGQGMGHEAVRANQGHCLLPLERFDLALRDLCAALEGTSHSVCLAAMANEAGRSLLPSDFFNYAYHAKTGQILDEDTFRLLANATVAWCEKNDALLLKPAAVETDEIEATKIAYDARRNPAQSFGPYEFAFREPPASPIQLPCKSWEDAWNHPATVWLEHMVGVGSWPEGTLSWPQAVGTWVHRWLASALRSSQDSHSTRNFFSSLESAANEEKDRIQNRARVAGLELYPWWQQVWTQAFSISRGLGETLVQPLENKAFLCEFRLPDNLAIALPGSLQKDFKLTGRIDLVLIESESRMPDRKTGDFSGCDCWVIDFKTGSAQSLTAKKIENGIGLQPLLYALALRALGAGPIVFSLHTFDTPLKPQVQLDEILQTTGLFSSLEIFHRKGIFGMRGDAQNEYGYSPVFPMATQFVSKTLLDAKWNLLHGGKNAEEEGT
jgi:hypothetical protein